jgi:hypothetical protein
MVTECLDALPFGREIPQARDGMIRFQGDRADALLLPSNLLPISLPLCSPSIHWRVSRLPQHDHSGVGLHAPASLVHLAPDDDLTLSCASIFFNP